ncbi:hypothetical protein [Lacipirellula sp.]|uniref:hypothetical protein n=1 Tax=Lacipirellula sp. TaxID=2691419 RepID=UPI003D134258
MIELLKSEAERLTRDVFILSETPNERGVVGYWGGVRADLPNEVSRRDVALRSRKHLFSFDEDLLTELELPKRGAVAVFEYAQADGRRFFRVHDEGVRVAKDYECSGIPLYAYRAKCVPPFYALCLFGSREIEDWLQSFGLTRFEYWKLQDEDVEAYEEFFRESYYLYQADSDAAIVVNPWTIAWPSDPAYRIPPLRCTALTLKDAEPWYELWYSDQSMGYSVEERIT